MDLLMSIGDSNRLGESSTKNLVISICQLRRSLLENKTCDKVQRKVEQYCQDTESIER